MNHGSPGFPKIYLVGGLTGSGKTELLHHLSTSGEQVIDLERLCNHDGSAFAPLRFGPQPSSYSFHKQLNHIWDRFDKSKPIFIENELQRIGRLKVPNWLYTKMSDSPIIWLNTAREIRVQRLSNIIRCSDPVAFCNCVNKLSPRFGSRHIENVIHVFSTGDVMQTVELLLDYYDNSKGYVISHDRLILQLEVTCLNLKPWQEYIVNKLTSLMVNTMENKNDNVILHC